MILRARAAESVRQGLLTPSELLLLHAEELIHPPLAGHPEETATLLPHTEERVSARELAISLLATAILANEEACAVHLEVKDGSGEGRPRVGLYLRPGNIMPDWPDASLEDTVDFLVGWAAHNGHNEVWDLVYHLLDRDDTRPERLVIAAAEEGLGRRGLLQECGDEECPFTPSRWVLRGRMARFVARESAQPLRGLLERAQEERLEIWRLLREELELAFERRTEDMEQ
jgi:hypothetical protein